MAEAKRAQQSRVKADAKTMLAQSMQMARSRNVIAIITKCGDYDSVLQKLKLEQKAMGDQYRQILQPLSQQGIAYLDSGKKSFMYLPDQRIVFECDSDIEGLQDLASRAELAAKNYELRCEAAASQVAGRSTYCVVAEPRVEGLPARQFYLDQQTLYPLRFALAGDNGSWKISMDTQVIDFPKDMPDLILNPVGTPRKVKFDPAQPLFGVRNLKGRLGFDPVVPKQLPFGFEVQRSELRKNEDGNLAVLWLTDGLATARVYEFRCNQMREGIWSQGANTVLTEDGVTMFMVSDLAQNVRKSLLSAFAHRQPFSIPPPAPGRSVNLGIKAPPVPAEEPNGPKQMLSKPLGSPGSATPPPMDGDGDSETKN